MLSLDDEVTNLPEVVLDFLDLNLVSQGECLNVGEIFRKSRNYLDLRESFLDFSRRYLKDYLFNKWRIPQNSDIIPIMFIKEALKNVNDHGRMPLSLKVFLTPSRMVTGFRDSGDFYKDEKVKEKIESRKEFPQKPQRIKEGRKLCSLGISEMYQMSDLIYVDTLTGTLYLGFKKTEGIRETGR